MPSPFDGIDIEDPCAVWPILHKAHLNLLAGKTYTRVRIGQDDVSFGKTDIAALERKVNELKSACEASQSGRRRRRAFTAGFR